MRERRLCSEDLFFLSVVFFLGLKMFWANCPNLSTNFETNKMSLGQVEMCTRSGKALIFVHHLLKYNSTLKKIKWEMKYYDCSSSFNYGRMFAGLFLFYIVHQLILIPIILWQMQEENMRSWLIHTCQDIWKFVPFCSVFITVWTLRCSQAMAGWWTVGQGADIYKILADIFFKSLRNANGWPPVKTLHPTHDR